MPREAIEAAAPKPLVKVEPCSGLVQRLDPEPAATVLAVSFIRNERSFLQHFEVPGDSRQRNRERLGQLADRRLAPGQSHQDRPTGWIGESFEGMVDFIHLIRL